MILVTGTKRSGTSMWMQILEAAGFPVLGDKFLGPWEASIKDANPRGFYESKLRQGVFYATNPDPKTGAFLRPQDTRRHVVKVFIPGVARSDVAYLDRVVGSIRAWRDYGPSIQRLYAMEDEWLAKQGPEDLARARARRSKLPPHVEWFLENYELIRDFSARRYPLRIHAYERLLEEPERIVGNVIAWLGGGDVDAAVAAVDPGSRTRRDNPTPDGVPDAHVEVFDELYETLYEERGLGKALITRMDALRRELVEEYGALDRERGRE